MKQILPNHLWLGPPDERDHFRQVLAAGIRAMVYLAAEDAPPMPPRDLICCRFPILDGTGNDADVVLLAVHTLNTLLKLHVPTLVHCATAPAVRSRSPLRPYRCSTGNRRRIACNRSWSTNRATSRQACGMR